MKDPNEKGHHHHSGHGRERFRNDNTLPGLLHRCGHIMHHRFGHSSGQRRVLRLLAEQGQISQKTLQEQLMIQSGSVSELISKLEAKGLVRRQKDEQDRRQVLLVLTEDGKAAAAADSMELPQEELFSVLTAEEQQTLQRLLQKLCQSWEQ